MPKDTDALKKINESGYPLQFAVEHHVNNAPFMRDWCAPKAPAIIEIRRCTTLSAKWTKIPLDQIDFTDPSLDWRRAKIKIEGEWYYFRRSRAAVRATHAARAKAMAELYLRCVERKHELEVLPGAGAVCKAIRDMPGCSSTRQARAIYRDLVQENHLSADLSKGGRRATEKPRSPES